MFKHILVPLDGSDMSEVVIPATAYLARTLNATVTLLHVLEHNAPEAVHGQRHITNAEEGQHYLVETAAAIHTGGSVEAHVHPNREDNVARSIAEHAEELGVDLIVMCTHGRGGVRRWLFGSIAQKVIALGDTPVLLIHPEDTTFGRRFICRRILGPLDGNPEHETGLEVAMNLAQECAASLHLVMVVPTPGTLSGEDMATAMLLPTTTAAVLELSQQTATEYLQRQAQRTAERKIPVTTEVRRGEPAAAIATAAQVAHADLIVMATHGKSHTDAFWSGSVSPKVSSRWHLPLLLVPVPEQRLRT
jgi:nucleotide-binding universal stress UspA family protein